MPTSNAYRDDIDGLRAIAILAVILFHAGFDTFSGGFIGVDIFFVISGYLITKIIVTEKRAGEFSFKRFYERRIRRIIPALLFVIACVLVAGYFVYSPLDYRSVSLASFSALLFLGNVTSYQQTDYFDSAAELKPTLHLWSLAIEEQYYFLAPIIILLLISRKKHIVYFALTVAIALSVFRGEYLIEINQRAAFYFLPSRFWELMLGAMTGIISLDQRLMPKLETALTKTKTNLLCFLGFAMMLYPVFYYSNKTNFPGLNALIPTLGTAIILLYNNPGTYIYRLLTIKPLVLIGIISYSSYLWHQPLFAMVRYKSINEINTIEKLSLVMVTFVIAFFSYKFIETPFRQKWRISYGKTLRYLGLAFLVISLACIYIYQSKGIPQRFDGAYTQALLPFKIREDDLCNFKSLGAIQNVESCEFGSSLATKTVYLMGDSHASVIIGGLDQEFKKLGIKGYRVKINGCAHFIPGMIAGEPSTTKAEQAESCNNTFTALIAHMKETHADAVIVNVRWASRFSPIPGRITNFAFNNELGGVEIKPEKPSFAKDGNNQWAQGESAKHTALSEFITRLASSSPKLFIVYPTPEPGWDVPKYNFSHYLKHEEVPDDITVKYSLFNKRQAFIKEAFDSISHPSIIRIIPEKYLCEPTKDICYLQRSHVAYYYDTNHLSFAGSKPLVDEIMADLRNP